MVRKLYLNIVVAQSLSGVWLFLTPWTAAQQASLSFTISPRSLLKLMSHWISYTIQPSHPLSFPSPFACSLSQHQGLFQWVGSCIRWLKYWSFSINPSSEYSRLISFRIDWFNLLAIQGTLKSLLQYHSSKTSIQWSLAFFMVQLSHP